MIGAAIDLDTDKVDRLLMRTDSDGFDMLTVAVKTLREQLAVYIIEHHEDGLLRDASGRLQDELGWAGRRVLP
jgi:hypothetical protein